MKRSIVTGFLALALGGCGDDDGGGATTTDTDTSSSGGTNPSTSGASMTTDPTTTDPSTTTTDPGTTTSSDETTLGTDTGEVTSSSTDDGSSSDSTSAVEFTLSSPAFDEGGLFPVSMRQNAGNVSPQLDWVGAPAGTMGFGVFFRDTSIDFSHSAIWNISIDLDSLPEGREQSPMPTSVPGAVQCRSWIDPQLPPHYGYGGPGSQSNFYEFTLYALDSDDLSGEIDSESSLGEVRAALIAHSIDSTTLSGQTMPSP